MDWQPPKAFVMKTPEIRCCFLSHRIEEKELYYAFLTEKTQAESNAETESICHSIPPQKILFCFATIRGYTR